MSVNTENLPRWYFGGVASALAACVTHPLDLIKVQLQTQTKKQSIIPLAIDLVRKNGIVVGWYSGISASLCRQLTYNTVRFAVYDTGKLLLTSVSSKMALAFIAGATGGFIGTPPDKINVRMQNDVGLPPEKRYKHVFHGFAHVYRTEGFAKLFTGGGTVFVRAGVMAVGQLASYDQFKKMFLASGYFVDNLQTHFVTSLAAALVATTITQPLDVIKTRIMNAKPGDFKNVWHVVVFTAKEGPLAFYKGYVPAFLRIGPHTIMMFVIYEQMRLRFGYLPQNKK